MTLNVARVQGVMDGWTSSTTCFYVFSYFLLWGVDSSHPIIMVQNVYVVYARLWWITIPYPVLVTSPHSTVPCVYRLHSKTALSWVFDV